MVVTLDPEIVVTHKFSQIIHFGNRGWQGRLKTPRAHSFPSRRTFQTKVISVSYFRYSSYGDRPSSIFNGDPAGHHIVSFSYASVNVASVNLVGLATGDAERQLTLLIWPLSGSYNQSYFSPTRCLESRLPSPMMVFVGGSPQASGITEQSQT